VAQSWRGGGRQALLARLPGCHVEALDDGQARSAGSLAPAPRLEIQRADALVWAPAAFLLGPAAVLSASDLGSAGR
jgi:hypothetical protein